MKKTDLFLVVMAGGSGTRFWPKSTAGKPKQFLSFGKADSGSQRHLSLLEATLERFDHLVLPTQRLIVTTELLKSSVAAQAAGVTVLAEPQGRNTAPCIYWAAREVAAKNPQGVMLVMPSDHYIANQEKFVSTVMIAARWAAERDDLVALGVTPTRPETGYGYLKIAQHDKVQSSLTCYPVEQFIEKPNLQKAREFLESGNYLWNGGMFLWRAEVILAAFDRYMPEMKKAWDDSAGRVEVAYPKMTATSIDYGVMEKASQVVAFPLECGWDDLGSWTSLESLADSLGTRHDVGVVMNGEVVQVESQGNIVDAPGKLIALLGVKDMVVVQQGEVLLVADKSRVQDVRLVVEKVKKTHPHLI